PVGAARGQVELGILSERGYRDRAGARRAYEKARALQKGLEPALVRLRRLFDPKGDRIQASLAILDEQIAATQTGDLRADLLPERPRLSRQAARPADARTAYAEALRVAPEHPASMRGLEATLRVELARVLAQREPPKQQVEQLATELVQHLER